VGFLFGLSYVLWFPLQGLFIRLLSAAAERVLALMEHPPIVTALTAHGNSVTLHSYITGVAQPLTQVNFADLHVSVVLCLALALAVPEQSWWGRVRLCGLALTLIFLVLVVVCVVQVEVAAEGYASTHLALSLHTARGKTILDWALRKSSFVAVFLVPAFLFFITYLSAWTGAESPDRPTRGRWKNLTVVAVGCLLAGLLLITSNAARAGRVYLDGLRKIVALNPASPTAHLNLAFNLEKEGRLDEALESFRRALHLQPDLMAARFGEGNVLFSKGAYDEAANSYEEVLKHKPTDMLARYNLGTAYLDRGRYDLAKASYEAVLRSIPEDPATLKNLGQALIGLNQRCAALVPLERSTVLDAKLMTDATIGEQLRVLRSECRTRGQ
jgi:hypothetical protein